jgi:hypothetical protein
MILSQRIHAILPLIGKQSPVVMIREAFKKCSDQYPAPETRDLPFISDKALRDSIRMDLSAATSPLHNEEWKASTVLAGAVVEALLLWTVQHQQWEISQTTQKAPLKIGT